MNKQDIQTAFRQLKQEVVSHVGRERLAEMELEINRRITKVRSRITVAGAFGLGIGAGLILGDLLPRVGG